MIQRSTFIHQWQASRVAFGAGGIDRLRSEVESLGLRRAMVLSTPAQADLAERVAQALGECAVGVFSQAQMHVPTEIVRKACRRAVSAGADCVVAVGEGSTIGLGKALALSSGLPVIALPTTLAGSETTPIYGLTEDGFKKTGRDAKVLPCCVIYDPDLLRTLPRPMVVSSGLNAIAHAAEGLYAHDGTPITDLMAEEGIRATAQVVSSLGGLAADASLPTETLAQALYGAWLCGSVLGAVSMGLHHKICHTLGCSFDLPHAGCHAVMLPYTLAYNAKAAPEAMARIAHALGQYSSGPAGAFELLRSSGVPWSLRDLGLPEAALDHAADLALQSAYPNPRPLERGAILAMLRRAWAGLPPEG